MDEISGVTEIGQKNVSGYNQAIIYYLIQQIMFDSQQSKSQFTTLDHKTKLKKVKESLELLSKKSGFFADLRNQFKGQKEIQESALDAMYGLVMNLVFNGQKN